MLLNSYGLERFAYWDSLISPWATDFSYFVVCDLFCFAPSLSPASFGVLKACQEAWRVPSIRISSHYITHTIKSSVHYDGTVDAGGAEGSFKSSSSVGNRRHAGPRCDGGGRRITSGVLMDKVIVISP
jgi:hypothetical protein